VLAGLVRNGWASVEVETARVGGSTFGVVPMKITKAARQALAAGSQR
jgi:hypothetical protein